MNFGIGYDNIQLSPDLGYPSVINENNLRNNWEANSISHNLVLVNNEAQKAINSSSKVLNYANTDFANLIEIEDKRLYDINTYRSSAMMRNFSNGSSYILDIFTLKGGEDCKYIFHSMNMVAKDNLKLVNKFSNYGDYVKDNSKGFKYIKQSKLNKAKDTNEI